MLRGKGASCGRCVYNLNDAPGAPGLRVRQPLRVVV